MNRLTSAACIALAAGLGHLQAQPKNPSAPRVDYPDDWSPEVRSSARMIVPVAPPSRATPLPPVPRRLGLREAENYALANQPLLAASELRALAEAQRVTEARAPFFPQIQANAVGVKAKDDDSRLAAIGGISNPTILTRQSDGVSLSQLITDFGRTYFLTTSARANALSAAQRTEFTRQALIFRVDRAYFAAQGAQALVSVANQTISTNQVLLDRTRALAVSELKSSLDVSVAEVSVAQGRLLQLRAQAGLQEALAELSASLGLAQKTDFTLEPQAIASAPPAEVGPLIAQAWAHRPDLLAARADHDAAVRFARAEQAANYPTISAQGSGGITPARIAGELPNNYGAVGVNVSVPVFSGGLLTARGREATLRAQAAEKQLQAQETDAARDVYNAWFEAKTAFEGIALAERLVTSAQEALQLTQARYQAGTSSIVDLSQADLQQIQAQITGATARFEYQVRRRALDLQIGALK